MSYRPPYGSQPGGNYRVPGPGGMSNVQGQFTISTPQQQQQQQQSFQMMHQQQLPNPPQTQPQTGRIAPQMYSNQPGGRIYPTPGYNQMVMQPGQFIGQACPGVLQPGINQGFGQQAGTIPGIAPNIQAQQNITPEQQKKYAEKQKKLLEEQKKKEDQERKERYREEQKRKLKEFSSGGRSSIGSKSLDMGDLLSKSLMTSQQTSMVQTQGMQYQHGMPMHSVSFIPQGQVTPGLGVVSSVAQQQNSSGSATMTVTHSQSMDGGFSGFQKAAPLESSGQQGKEDDFGDFLHAPSNSGSVITQPGQETQLSEVDDESFGDFFGGPDASQSEQHPDKIQDESHSNLKTKGSSLENMMMQSTDLSESKKERKRFNQKPSLNEVKSSTNSQSKSVTSFTSSNKSRIWQQESEDLSTLFTLPIPAQRGQQTPFQGAVGQCDVGEAVTVPPIQQQQTPGQLPAWLQNEASLPVVYHQVLEASSQEGVIQTNLLYPIFLLSGLNRTLLGHIWSMVNYTLPGQLVAQELYIALALIAHAQRGHEVSISALCSVSEAPIPQLNQGGQPAQSQTTTLQQQGIASQDQQQQIDTTTTTTGAGAGDDDFAPFQEAPTTTSTTSSTPTVPAVLPSISKFASSSNKSGKKTASTLSSLVIPPSSSSTKTSSSSAYMQEENCYIFANSPAPSSGRSSPFIWDQNTIYDKLTTRSYDSASSSSLSDHTPTEGDDDESFDDFKSAPSDSGPTESELEPSPIPFLPGPGLKSLSASPVDQVKPSAGASHVPVLVPPKGMSPRTFTAIPPPPHGTKPGSNTVRLFGSEEKLRTGNDDFGDFKAACGETSNSSLGLKGKDEWGSFAGQQFKHSASESNLQGMNDRYAALRDIGSSLFDSDPLTTSQPVIGLAGNEEEEFADFQQAGVCPVSSSALVDTISMNIPGNQGSSAPVSDHHHQPNLGFAAFSPPKEGSDWAQTAKQDRDITTSSPHEEEFEGFFSARSNDSNTDVKKQNDEAVTDNYSSLAGLHSFVTDKDDEVEESFFGDFQASLKPHATSTSASASGSSSKTSVAPSNSGITLFRLTPPPMTSSPPSSEDTPGDDRFNVLRDLSAVDPFDDTGTVTPGMDGTGADYYETQFTTLENVKISHKAELELDDLNSNDLPQTSPHELELTLDTPSSTTNKSFPIGSIDQLDLKNYDLNLTVESNAKGTTDEPRERVELGDFTAASTSEQAPCAKDDSGGLPSSNAPPPPASVQSETSFFGDRYSQVAGDSSNEGRHSSEWEKCLIKCYEVMNKANSIFNNISTSSVCSEVIGSSAGIDYLTGVIEVYRVACRIITSIQGLGIDNDELGTLKNNINKIWHNLTVFLQLSSLKPTEGSFVFKSAMLRPEPSNTPQACGVCLLNVDSRSKAFDRSEDSHKLSYGGRQYHATCANMWVNMVDSILPALPLNTLL